MTGIMQHCVDKDMDYCDDTVMEHCDDKNYGAL